MEEDNISSSDYKAIATVSTPKKEKRDTMRDKSRVQRRFSGEMYHQFPPAIIVFVAMFYARA